MIRIPGAVRRLPALRVHAALALGCALVMPAHAAPAGEETTHIVAQGETLNGIANRAGVSAGDLASANGLAPPYVVRTGQRLAIPRATKARSVSTAPATPTPVPSSPRQYTVTSGETLNGIANRTGVTPQALAQANGIAEPYVVRVGQMLTIPGTGPDRAPRTASRTIAARPPGTSAASPSSGSSPNDASSESYVVKPGETLGGIANRTGVPRVLIVEANALQPPYTVKVGQTLHIPRTRHHTVGTSETGFSIALQYGVPWEQIAIASGIAPGAPLSAGQKLVIPSVLTPPAGALAAPVAKPAASPATPARTAPAGRFLWPVKGPIDRGFATGTDYHDGLDIKAAKGTMVRAAAAGTVRFAGLEKDQFGNLVVIDHGDGWFTAYAFLSRVTVKNGAKVSQGERVGLVGDTGLAKGDELHFEIRKDGKPVNPVDELPKAP
ncbi:LysM peptidoglycan-binding domain-containing protein [Novosphingobium profundi]|uniref:LysM peptidoglycan-binding domain-containing protein n=1 Tax=Novosphingobium profundi TaxID=1774954 RepID=UPI001BD92AD5|nr:LysM peptidoglycan-binding domain-containing protein [Novosphingobium profundi]MBT0666779.1 LysM peptidoglycan-binding domain-containing protein [Novosphingobium profundi]